MAAARGSRQPPGGVLFVSDDRAHAIGDPRVPLDEDRRVDNGDDHHRQRDVGIPVVGSGLPRLGQVVEGHEDPQGPEDRQHHVAEAPVELGVVTPVVDR